MYIKSKHSVVFAAFPCFTEYIVHVSWLKWNTKTKSMRSELFSVAFKTRWALCPSSRSPRCAFQAFLPAHCLSSRLPPPHGLCSHIGNGPPVRPSRILTSASVSPLPEIPLTPSNLHPTVHHHQNLRRLISNSCRFFKSPSQKHCFPFRALCALLLLCPLWKFVSTFGHLNPIPAPVLASPKLRAQSSTVDRREPSVNAGKVNWAKYWSYRGRNYSINERIIFSRVFFFILHSCISFC